MAAFKKNFPKQLMPVLGGEHSLLQDTLLRVMEIPDIEAPVIMTNESHRFIIASQLQEIGIEPRLLVLEPVGRSTAPAAAVASLLAMQSGKDQDILLLPADHYIRDVDTFLKCMACAADFIHDPAMVTFGIVPDKAETGYGYIKRNTLIPGRLCQGFTIDNFVEKPDAERAAAYIASGEYYWNSGMFMFRAEFFIRELEKYGPEILSCCREAVDKSREDLDFLRLDADAFSRCPENSVDYVVMEKTDRGVVVPLECGWNDVGSWSSLYDVRQKDRNGNVCIGDVVLEDSKGCYIHSTNRLVAGLGLEDITVVESKDALLVSRLDRVQDVKNIYAFLKRSGRREHETHCKVYRPWGNYETIDEGDRYQVKRIIVYPGQSLSLQKHYHRAEHWVVVKGTALVSKDGEEIILTEDQSTYIPLSSVHRLKNPGKVNLELIEVQTGSYLGEDDIVRFDDVYGRQK